MMNVVALCLVFTSLVTAGIRSTPPAKTEPIKQVGKEGHPAVEIEGDDGSTTVKISPQDVDASSLTEKVGHGGSAMEQVCDAFGNCKYKVEGEAGRSKEVLSEKARELKDRVGEVKGEAKHTVGERVGKVKDAVNEKYHVETLKKVKGAAKDATHSTKEKFKGVAEEAIKTGNTLQQDVWRNSTEEFHIIKEALKRYAVDFLNYVQPTRSLACGIMELLGMSVAYGTAVWVTLVSSYVMADALPRPQFAIQQSKIYTVYYTLMILGIGMTLVFHCLSPAKELIQTLNLCASLLAVLFNLKYLEPQANKLMFETMKLEKEEGRGMPTVVRNIDSLIVKSARVKDALNPSEDPSAAARFKVAEKSEKLKKLNYYSSLLNFITLLSLTGHLVHLGQILYA